MVFMATRPRFALVLFCFLCLLIVAASAGAAPTPQSIVKRLNDAYVHARSYEARFRTEMTLRGKASLSMLVHVQMIPGKKMRFDVTSIPGAKTVYGPQMPNRRVLVVDDGRQVWAYFPTTREYLHGKHMHTFRPALMSYGFMLGSLDASDSPWRLSRTIRRPGGAIWVVETVRPVPLGRITGSVRLFVDAATGHAKRIEMSAAPGGPPIVVTVTLLQERINASIPPSAFSFKLPRGARPAPSTGDELPLGPPDLP
jgi:outer membrane lipoprotein-sorting protein